MAHGQGGENKQNTKQYSYLHFHSYVFERGLVLAFFVVVGYCADYLHDE